MSAEMKTGGAVEMLSGWRLKAVSSCFCLEASSGHRDFRHCVILEPKQRAEITEVARIVFLSLHDAKSVILSRESINFFTLVANAK